jgi:hypothetical protein
VTVVIEPWGHPIEVMPGQTLTVMASGEAEGQLELQIEGSTTYVWAWPSATVRVVDVGAEILTLNTPVPDIPAGMTVRSFVELVEDAQDTQGTEAALPE